jgi:hypothetical protein
VIDDDPDMPPVTLRYLLKPSNWWIEITYRAYGLGIRGYCWVHDSNRWGWTHRHCARRQHELGQRIQDAINRGDG